MFAHWARVARRSGHILLTEATSLCDFDQFGIGTLPALVMRMPHIAMNTSPSAPVRPTLTPRETQVLASLVAGNSYKQVAAELEISIETVRTHIKSLYRKLGVHCVAEAVARALREGLVDGGLGRCCQCGAPAQAW